MDFKFRDKAFLIGFMGDCALQLYTETQGDLVGLKEYFKIHGGLESKFIAGGMMYLFAYIFELSGLPKTNVNLFLYGGALDVAFRQLKLMDSLNETYYKNISPINSFVWGGIPFVMVNML